MRQQLKLKFDKSDMRIGTKWVTNGHFALQKKLLRTSRVKALTDLIERVEHKNPDQALDTLVSNNVSGYVPLVPKPHRMTVDESLRLGAVVYRFKSFNDKGEAVEIEIGIAAEYAPLLDLPGAYSIQVKDSTSPVLLIKDVEIVGMIMPVRL